MFASRLSGRPSLSSSASCASGVPSASQSACGGVVDVPGAPGAPGTIAPDGRMIGEREVLVFGPRTFVKIISRKRVAFLTPVASVVRSAVSVFGTTTVIFVFDDDVGRTRTDLPSDAREKNTRLFRAPDAKYLPFRVSVPPIGTWLGEAD